MDELNKNNATEPLKPETEKGGELVKGMASDLGNFLRKFGEFIHDITDIREGLDEQGTRDSIKKNIQIKGSNVWLLGAAIMVASLGLDLNSPAVIIGAMLISPLMSPILGVGLSVGINDNSTLYESLYHFGVAIAVSLIVSALYFWITPLGKPTSEILARTSPTLLDVLVAFFGGIAGIVSGSRLEKSNAIPGVAIATALLPPLCVSGYGLATGNWTIFFNSFYLFFLNCVFIALATYLVVRFLNFRPKKYVDAAEQNRSTLVIAIFVAVMVIPSIFILRGVVEKIQRDNNIEKFITEYLTTPNRSINWECNPMKDKKGRETDSLLLNISLIGDIVPKDSIPFYERLLPQYNIKHTHLTIVQTYSADVTKIDEKHKQEIHKEKETNRLLRDQMEYEINGYIAQLDSLVEPRHQLRGIQILYPEMEELSFKADMENMIDSFGVEIPTLLVKWKRGTGNSYKRSIENRLGEFMQRRMELDTIQIIEKLN